jgi:hypothetical protein
MKSKIPSEFLISFASLKLLLFMRKKEVNLIQVGKRKI